jgi:two-component system, sensor histidine kinase and response regulator
MPGDRDRCLKAGMDDYLAKPVRPDDLRKVIEKWGSKASAGIPAGGSETSLPSTDGQPAVGAQAQGSSILDWERLMEMADNDRDMLKELVSLYIEETEKQMEQLGAAVATSSAPEVKRLAHKCAGGSATIGVGRLVPLLRELEDRGAEDRLEGSNSIYERAREEFGILRKLLRLHPDGVLETNVR